MFNSVGVPVNIVMPAAEIVLLFMSNEPLLNVSCLVAPSVRLFANVQVAVLVALPNIHGKS